MIYIYIVGPLFNQAEAKQRIYEGTYLKKELDLIDTPYQIVNPIELPVNDGAADSIAIYQADYRHQCKANVVFFDLSNSDTGSHTALGVMLEKKRQKPKIHLYPVFSDQRLKRNGAFGLESTVGFNSYVVGALKANQIAIYDTFEQAAEQFFKDVQAGAFHEDDGIS